MYKEDINYFIEYLMSKSQEKIATAGSSNTLLGYYLYNMK
jgi:hypothetical protein